jgi:hypothetical protein
MFTAVNADRVSGADGFPGGSTRAHLNSPAGIVVASDGTAYFAATPMHRIFSLSAAGHLSVLAGTGTCGHTGDGSDAALATLCSPQDVALDETHGPSGSTSPRATTCARSTCR